MSCTFMIPDTTLTFDLSVKFIGFMIWLCVHTREFLSFHIVKLCECITMVQCVVYIHDLCMTFTFDLNIFTMNLRLERSSLLFDIGIPNFGIWYITVKQLVVYIPGLYMALIFYLDVGDREGGFLVSFTHRFSIGHFIPLIDHLIR